MTVEAFTGEIRMFAGTFPPRDWAFCDGQLLPISQHQALYSILGTHYGGDGRSTFGLPDLRGRVPLHAGNEPDLTSRRLGQQGGREKVTLDESQMPAHTHTTVTKASSSTRSEIAPDARNAYWGPGSYTNDSNVNMAMDAVVTNASGGGKPVSNVQPFTAINFIICLDSVFPPRS